MSTSGRTSASTTALEISPWEISPGTNSPLAGWSFYARFYAWRFS